MTRYRRELYRVRLLGSTGPVIHGPSTFLEFTSSHRYTSLLNIALSRDRGTTEPRGLRAPLRVVFSLSFYVTVLARYRFTLPYEFAFTILTSTYYKYLPTTLQYTSFEHPSV